MSWFFQTLEISTKANLDHGSMRDKKSFVDGLSSLTQVCLIAGLDDDCCYVLCIVFGMTGTKKPKVWTNSGQWVSVLVFPTFSRAGEDLFGDVELVLCCSGPVFHPSPALHREVDITGNCWHWLSLDGYHWTNGIPKTVETHCGANVKKKNAVQCQS